MTSGTVKVSPAASGYIVFKYWKYNEGEKIDYYTNFSAECWFEVPQYNE